MGFLSAKTKNPYPLFLMPVTKKTNDNLPSCILKRISKDDECDDDDDDDDRVETCGLSPPLWKLQLDFHRYHWIADDLNFPILGEHRLVRPICNLCPLVGTQL